MIKTARTSFSFGFGVDKGSIESNWENVSSRIKAVFNFGIENAEWLESSRTARFIAAIPFLAGCEKAEETSFTHLAVYILSIDQSSKEIYFHKPEDDKSIYSRLAPMSNFKGGDPRVIKCCMDLLALNIISDYEIEQEADKSIGKYNPVSEEKWNSRSLKDKLIREIKKSITPEIAAMYTIDDALYTFWKQ